MKCFSFSSLRFRLLLMVLLASIPAMGLTVNHAIEDRSAATTRIQAETVQLTQLTVSAQDALIKAIKRLGAGDLSVRTGLTYDKGEDSTVSRTNITLAVSLTPMSAPFFIADEKGFFVDEGIDALHDVKPGAITVIK